jgi:hypothetical protein
MMFPLDLTDVSLILAIITIILLVTSDFLSSRYGKVEVSINKKKLKHATIAVTVLFVISLALRITTMVI